MEIWLLVIRLKFRKKSISQCLKSSKVILFPSKKHFFKFSMLNHNRINLPINALSQKLKGRYHYYNAVFDKL